MFSFKKMCKSVWKDIKNFLKILLFFIPISAIFILGIYYMTTIPLYTLKAIRYILGLVIGILLIIMITGFIVSGLYEYLKSKGTQ